MVIFDYPTSDDLAEHLRDRLAPAAPPLPALAELDRFEAALAADGLDPAVRDQIASRAPPELLLAGWQPAEADGVVDRLEEASDEEDVRLHRQRAGPVAVSAASRRLPGWRSAARVGNSRYVTSLGPHSFRVAEPMG